MKTRSFLLASIVILAALFFSGVVFADGEVPQAPAAEELPVTPEETPIALEEAAVLEAAPPPAEGEPAPEEPAVIIPPQPFEGDIPAEPVPAVTEVQPEAPAIEAAPVVAEVPPVVEAPVVLDTAPEAMIPDQATVEEPALMTVEPEVLLVDPAGEPLDMASQASAETIASADPYFTVGLITYRFSSDPDYCLAPFDLAHCFDSNTLTPVTGSAIQFAIDYIWQNPGTNPTNGMIYVEKETYSDNVTINASDHTALATLKGLIGLADPVTGEFPTISGNVSISHLSTGFTLSGFTINGFVDIDGITGALTLTDLDVSDPTLGGIQITEQTGNVVMTNVRSSHNASTGADIDNTNGGNVTITNSAFDDNGTTTTTYGLYIWTNGVVTINGVSASRNYDSNLSVRDFSSLTVKNAILNGYMDVWGSGLVASTTKPAPVVIQNVTASNNAWYGISITTLGSISLASVDALENQSGIMLVNNSGVGAVTTTTIRANNNSLRGLDIASQGALTLTNIEASSNGNEGLLINSGSGTITINKTLANWTNDFSDNVRQGINITTQGIVNISSSTASGNKREGIKITGKGAITLTDVEAFSNGLAGTYKGLWIDNTAGTSGVTIRSTVLTDYMDFSGNTEYGIFITSKGAVSVNSVQVNDNTSNGLYIGNNSNPTASPAVTITNGEFNNNHYKGVMVTSKGVITLMNVSASGSLNGQPGVFLDNTSGTSSGVTIRSSSLSVFYEFSKNTGSGIEIYSKGFVSVSNIIAEGNGGDGIKIENYEAGSNLPVTISSSLFNSNSQNGISTISLGAVKLTNVGAANNTSGYGVYILNQSGSAYSSVTLSSTLASKFYDFSNNGLDGIRIVSTGAVSIGNVTANENKNYGMNIDRTFGTGAISISRGTFDHNTFGGAQILTTPSAIALTDVSASYNDPTIGGYEYSGVLINTTYGSPGGSVTVKSSTTAAMYAFSHNTDYGLNILSSGPISISNVIAEGNGNTNINLENQTAANASPKLVSVTRSTANGSISGDGFYITTKGNVTLNSLTANENMSGNGLFVDAGDGFVLTPAVVTLSGARNEFNANGGDGIHIETEGNISLTNAIADENSGFGICLDSAGYTDATGNVAITASTNFWNSSSGNAVTGLDIVTNGTVTISRLHAYENGNSGIMIDNVPDNLLPKNVTLTSVDANRNRGEPGLYINSLGAVVLNSTRADSNEQTGLRIYTNGAVTLNGVSTSYNSTHEADIPSTSATIYERLTSDSEGDIWKFVGTTSPYTILLSSTEFDAYLEVFHWNTISETWDLVISNDNSGGGTNALISIPGGLVNGDEYYVLATTADQWGAPGDYTLGFNTPGTAYSYEYFGAYIDNHNTAANITITSPANFWSVFNENNYTGVYLYTNGVVSITNTDASNNDNTGINIEGTPGPANVIIRNTSATRLMQISDNGDSGIYVPNAYGTITLSGWILANDNGNTGVYLMNNNVADLAPKAVTITSLTASGNQGVGLYAESKGAITLTSITANGNQSVTYGVYVRNSFDGMYSNITINGTNLISNNEGVGLNAKTDGTLSITGVRAENNKGNGLELRSYTDGKSVTLSNIIAQYNGTTGVYLQAFGTVTLTNVRSCVNGTVGVSADGIRIFMFGDYHTYINNSATIGNTGSGIEINVSKSLLHLLGTFFFGNDSDNVDSELDLYYSAP